MHTDKPVGSFFSTRNVIIIACAALLVFLGAVAIIVAVMGDTGDMGDRDYIESNISSLGDADLGYKNVAEHIQEYGIGGFNASKLRRVELYFKNEYPKELPSVGQMAKLTAELYMEYYYDKVDKSDKEAITNALLRCFVESTGDRYAVYRTEDELEAFDIDMSGEFVGIGVSVEQSLDPATGRLEKMVIRDVISGSPAEKAGILAEDLIISVDGRPLTEFDGNGIVNAIRGEAGKAVVIGVRRDEQELSFTCVRATVVDLSVRYSTEGGIGYIEISSFKENTPKLFAEAMSAIRSAGVSGIVFDLRDNPGGYLNSVLEVLDAIVSESGVALASYVDAAGRETVYSSTGAGSDIRIPTVVICNENTASAGELFTAALRDFAAMGIIETKIVGKTTYGKGIMQNTYMLHDGSSITLTTAFYNPPSGKNYDGVGITPNVIVDAAEGNIDTQLERAIEELGKPASSDQNSNL